MHPRQGLYFDASSASPGGQAPVARDGRELNSSIAYAFYWSHRRLRRLGIATAMLAIASAPAMLSQSTPLRALCLGWFMMLAAVANGLARRVKSHEPVITIDRLGLRDSRTLERPIYWQDIRTLCRCHPTRSRVVELFLIHPRRITAKQRSWIRFGGWLQRAFGVPAVTISLLLVDASAADIFSAIAIFRPGLIPRGMETAD